MADTRRHAVCALEELPPGTRKLVDVDGVSVGVFNVGGEFHAIRNLCPHRGAPLCEGTIGGTMLPSEPHQYEYGMEDRLLRCPWHGWEIDIATGEPSFNQARGHVRTYPVAVREGTVVIEA
jgi:nitrite reductase (NADH) small subunit